MSYVASCRPIGPTRGQADSASVNGAGSGSAKASDSVARSNIRSLPLATEPTYRDQGGERQSEERQEGEERDLRRGAAIDDTSARGSERLQMDERLRGALLTRDAFEVAGERQWSAVRQALGCRKR